MRGNLMRAAVAAVLAVVASVVVVAVASAHAAVTQVQWDNPTHPTKVLATAAEEIKKETGTYYLKVFNAQGQEVDKGDWTVVDTNRRQMTVSVQPNLPPGSYRVDWQTVSDADGDQASGSLTLALAGASVTPSPAPSQAGQIAAPSTGSGPAPRGAPWPALGLVAAAVLSLAGGATLLAVRSRR